MFPWIAGTPQAIAHVPDPHHCAVPESPLVTHQGTNKRNKNDKKSASLIVTHAWLSLVQTRFHSAATVLGTSLLYLDKVRMNGSMAPRLLILDTRWRWVASVMLRPFYLRRKIPGYPLDRRLSGPHSPSACGGEEKYLALPGTDTRTPSL